MKESRKLKDTMTHEEFENF
jgi:hypothetical protein